MYVRSMSHSHLQNFIMYTDTTEAEIAALPLKGALHVAQNLLREEILISLNRNRSGINEHFVDGYFKSAEPMYALYFCSSCRSPCTISFPLSLDCTESEKRYDVTASRLIS